MEPHHESDFRMNPKSDTTGIRLRESSLPRLDSSYPRDAKRRSGMLPSRCSEQRLALDAGLCGGLIMGKGARLRIRHRLAPLPLAAPRDAAFAAPPASPSPECGIEGIPAAAGRILRLAERPQAAARGHPARFRGGLPPSLRRPRDRPGRHGGPRRRLRVAARVGGAPLPRRRLPGAHPQPRSPRAASAPGAISEAVSPG